MWCIERAIASKVCYASRICVIGSGTSLVVCSLLVQRVPLLTPRFWHSEVCYKELRTPAWPAIPLSQLLQSAGVGTAIFSHLDLHSLCQVRRCIESMAYYDS